MPMESTSSRWKGKGFSDIAIKNPISEIMKQLQSSLTQSKSEGMLSNCISLVKVNPELANLLDRTSFGRPITTVEKDNQWFQLSAEETFYLHHALQSLIVVTHNAIPLHGLEIWNHMKDYNPAFPELYIAYAHLRAKNWVVRAGAQYGADFVAYRHHPSLVHSDYAVVVLKEGGEDKQLNGRLRDWSDLHCRLRVSGSVAKTLLVLFVRMNGNDTTFPFCLQQFSVEERIFTRWVAEQCREDDCLVKDCQNDLNVSTKWVSANGGEAASAAVLAEDRSQRTLAAGRFHLHSFKGLIFLWARSVWAFFLSSDLLP